MAITKYRLSSILCFYISRVYRTESCNLFHFFRMQSIPQSLGSLLDGSRRLPREQFGLGRCHVFVEHQSRAKQLLEVRRLAQCFRVVLLLVEPCETRLGVLEPRTLDTLQGLPGLRLGPGRNIIRNDLFEHVLFFFERVIANFIGASDGNFIFNQLNLSRISRLCWMERFTAQHVQHVLVNLNLSFMSCGLAFVLKLCDVLGHHDICVAVVTSVFLLECFAKFAFPLCSLCRGWAKLELNNSNPIV